MTTDRPFCVLPDGEPPDVSPAWRHLLKAPCARCASSRIFPQTLYRRMVVVEFEKHAADFPLYRTETLCGDCGHLEERSDPDDRWERRKEMQERLEDENRGDASQ